MPQLTKAPELKKFVPAVYPEAAKKEGLTADVNLFIDIGPDGKVANAEVAQSSGRQDFDEAAVAAVKQFEFSPAEIDGKPALVRIQYLYRFVMQEPEKPKEEEKPPPPPPVTIKGKAIERGSRSPIPGAHVACLETSEETSTDALGKFELHAAPGACTVQVMDGAHEPYSHREEVKAGEVLEVTYHLMPRSFGLYQSVTRSEREKREATRRTLEREELQKVPGSMGDPIRVIQNLPGIARAPYVSGQLIVRGAAPDETGTYFDGVEIPLLYHFLGGPSVVNPEFLDRIDFYPGGFGVRYGRAVGGVLDASTRRANLEEFHGSAKVDLIDSAAFVEGPLGGSTGLAIAARRSYIDTLLPLVTPSTPNGTLSVLPRYWDYQARVDHAEKGSKHAFNAMVFGSDDKLSVAVTGNQAARNFSLDTETSFHRGRFSWLFRDGRFTNNFSPFIGWDFVNLGASGDLNFGITQYAGGLRDEAAFELPGKSVLRLGTDIALQQAHFEVDSPPPPDYRSFPGERPVQPHEHFDRRIDTFDYGFYAEAELKPHERLALIPGVRVDQFRLHGVNRSATDARFTARYKLFEPTFLKGSIGHYTMPPDATQFDPQIGNPQLGLEKAFQASLGVEHKFTDAINVDVTGFYNRRYDRVVGSSKVTVLDDGTVIPERLNNDGLGRAYGLEVMLRHEITSHFFGWVAYTLMRTEERRRGDEKYVVGSYDEPHILTVVGQYKIGNGWEVGSRFRLVSGRPQTPVIGSFWDGDTDSYRAITGEPRSERASLFHQLDARVDKTWLYDNWKLGVYLDVQNVYWAENPEGVTYDYRYREKTEIPGLPILPTLGVKGSF